MQSDVEHYENNRVAYPIKNHCQSMKSYTIYDLSELTSNDIFQIAEDNYSTHI